MTIYKIYIVVVLCILLLSCKSKHDYRFLENAGISSQDWKSDTFGCLSYRHEKAKIVLGLKQHLLKLNKAEVISFFGKPDFEKHLNGEKEILSYINEPNLYCQGKVLKEYVNQLETTSINFIFDKKGNLTNIVMPVP